MSDSPSAPQGFPFTATEPRRIGRLNGTGLLTLIGKETGRFLNVYTQTIVAPVVTTLLFYAVFSLALGGAGRSIGGIPYMQFLAPGLIMMTMVQNAFANTSSSLIISKVQGNIVDVLMPPLSAGELFMGYAAGGVLRGLVVGLAAGAAVFVFVPATLHSVFHVVVFAVLGNLLLASLGIAGGIWSQKFDHIAAVTNFIVTPMTFLSGTFYSIDRLPEPWRAAAHFNPFFHMIDGFRYGFTGHADSDPVMGILLLAAVNLALALLCFGMLRSGYRIRQ